MERLREKGYAAKHNIEYKTINQYISEPAALVSNQVLFILYFFQLLDHTYVNIHTQYSDC